MALLDDIKLSLRLTGDDFDAEVQNLIDAAIADMRRVGVKDEALDSETALVKMAVTCYAKARFGFDNEDASYFDSSYRQIVTDLVNSSQYETAMGDK